MKDLGLSRRVVTIALTLLVFIYAVRLIPRDAVANTKSLIDKTWQPAAGQPASDPDGRPPFRIRDKVALLSDTQYSPRLIPLILHFHAVLGPEWPIVMYTSQETADAHLSAERTTSALWRRALQTGAVDLRIIPDEYNMTSRDGVNVYLSRPWLWQQLAPAKHVLVFQTDAMICANSHRSLDDFLAWDFIAAPLHTSQKLFNGGLSLRNRTMMMEILDEGLRWEAETASGAWTLGGEDIWFSRKMDLRGAHLPSFNEALQFACQHEWHTDKEKEPFGYHKVHKVAKSSLPEIAEWCPEIALAAPGTLAQ